MKNNEIKQSYIESILEKSPYTKESKVYQKMVKDLSKLPNDTIFQLHIIVKR